MRQIFRTYLLLLCAACLSGAGAPLWCCAQEAAPATTAPAAETAVAAPVDFANKQWTEIRDYTEPVRAEVTRNTTMFSRVAKEARFGSPDEENTARNYFRFRAAEFTWPEKVKELPKKRRDIALDLRKAYGAHADDRTIHMWLNNEIFNNFKAIASGEAYHPAARYNAMLVIGELNQIEPDIGGRGAVPWSKTLEFLIPTINDEKQLDAVRVAAIDGLVRHAELSTGADVRRQLATLFTNIAKTKKPSGAMQPATLAWLRRRSVVGLAAMAVRGAAEANKPDCVSAVRDVLEDESLSVLARSDAALALGAFDKSAIGATRVMADCDALARLVIAAGTFDPAALSAGQVNPEWLGYYFMCVSWGLRGYAIGEQNKLVVDPNRGVTAAAAAKDAKDATARLLARVDGMIKVCMNKTFKPEELATLVSDLAKSMKVAGEPVAVGGGAAGS